MIDPLSYLLPCCNFCQTTITTSFGFNALVEQQTKLVDQINQNTEVIHQSATRNNVKPIHEANERFEALLVDIKKQLTTTRSSSGSSPFDAMDEVKKSVSESVKTTMAEIAQGLAQIHKVTQEIAINFENSTRHTQKVQSINSDVLDELKALTLAVSTFESKSTTTPVSPPVNLADELDDLNLNLFTPTSTNSGWRWFNGRRTSWKKWRADWSEFDSRNRKRRATNKGQQNTDSINNIRNPNFNSRNNSNNLPPDRILLAAAKDRFSRPPPFPYRPTPTIRFQQGETLNPYPVDDEIPTTSCAQDSRSWMFRMTPEFADGFAAPTSKPNGSQSFQ